MTENEKPLTLSELTKYNQSVLMPALENRFCAIEDRLGNLENRFYTFEERGRKDKNDIMLSFDQIFKKLDILIENKKVRDYQHDREKRLWQIMVDSLKTNRLLTNRQQKEIDDLEVI